MKSIDVRAADFDADYEAIRRIRFEVFVHEQNVPENIEMDDRDAHCVHVLAYFEGRSIGAARIDLGSDGKIGRVAVEASARKRGVGSALMQALHSIADGHGVEAVWCNAQVSALPFYERLGYRVTSEPFFEAGIEHVRMEKSLLVGHDALE